MSGRWSKNKKKPLETTLGQAPKEDTSHLRKPITTSVTGLRQVLTLFTTATAEVKDYITYECEMLYECRICRTIFRSLANFILHKRSYCKEKFDHSGLNPEDTGGFVRAAEKETEAEKTDKKTILPIIYKLVKKQEINILAQNTLTEDFSSKKDDSDDDVMFVSEETNNVVLQKIDTSEAAVFQTSVNNTDLVDKNGTELMKSEVMEIHGILENNDAVLDSTGKVNLFETNKKTFKPNIPRKDLTCPECDITFSTEKTLTFHIKYKHNKTSLVFFCPDCKETFARSWGVYRHLFKVHRRTNAQIRRMRAHIHSSLVRRDQEPEKKKEKNSFEDVFKDNEENQWLNNFEGDKDLQMCGGCGKRFERKAALHSHSQMCTKRIAVCNTIKDNLKTKQAENKQKVSDKAEKVEEVVKVAKGAAKRKPNSKFVNRIPFNDKKNEVVLEKVDEILSDSEEEEEEEKIEDVSSSFSSTSSSIHQLVAINNKLTEEITITKLNNHEDVPAKPDVSTPEIEIFTISDDEEERTPPPWEFIKVEPSSDLDRSSSQPVLSRKSTKRKRGGSFDVDPKTQQNADDYNEFMNDEMDGGFFASKDDCEKHASARHDTPDELMECTVLPIPKWKVLLQSHNFIELTDEIVNNNPVNPQEHCDVVIEDDCNNTMPRLEPIQDTNIDKDPLQKEATVVDTIIVDDDEMPDICNDNSFVISDEETPPKERKTNGKAGPSKAAAGSVACNRPIRNRTKSVKTVHDDFIYDLAKVLKLNDSCAKSGKTKKGFAK